MADRNQDKQGLLPPGSEHLRQLIYGELEIKIKKLNYLNILHREGDVRVRLSFYGEYGASRVLVPQNSSRELLRYFKTSYKYLIACNIWQFQHYLLDMNMLRISVVDHNNLILGFVDIVFSYFLSDDLTENSQSLFKNLKGNFAITSPRDPSQKIGSIELEITNAFDCEISRLIREGELQNIEDIEIENYVMRRLQQKQSFSGGNTVMNPFYNSSSEQTQILTVKPEYQDMFGQRIPASLVVNNEGYDQHKYSDSNFYSENQNDKKQNQNLPQQNINNQNAIRGSQQDMYQNNNKQQMPQQQQTQMQQQQQLPQQNNNNQNAQRGSQQNMYQNNKLQVPLQSQQQFQQDQQMHNMQQQARKSGNISNSGVKQTMKQQANQSNSNINNSMQNNKDSTNPNDNAFVLSSENSLFMQRQNETTQEQMMKMAEIDKTNKQITNKLDRLVNLGEQMVTQYQDQAKQQKQLDQQRAKDEQARIELENKKMQLQTQKMQLRERELKEQQLERERQAQKENQILQQQQQQTFKQTNFNTFTTTANKKRPFPVNQQLFQQNRIKIQMFDFTCTDNNFFSKISQKNVYMECILPPNLNCKQQDADIMKTVCKNIVEKVFKFNTEINQNIVILPDKIEELLNETIEFQIKSFSIPKNTIDIGKNTDLVTLLSVSHVSIKDFLTKSINFSGLFHLEMKTRFQSAPTASMTQKQPKQFSDSKQMVIKKTDLKPIESNDESVIGTLKVAIQMFKDNFMPATIYSQHHSRQTQPNFNNQLANATNEYSNQPYQTTIQIVKNPTVSFQLYLRFSNFQFINTNNQANSLPDKTTRKIYLQFKVYGTQENITTKQIEIKRSNQSPSFDSEFIMPCIKDMLVKMRKVPFVVEVWEKLYEKEDQLLGIINLDLSQISNSVLDKKNLYNDNWCSNDNANMIIIVSNEFKEFTQIPTKKIIGQIYTTFIFGSVAQISKYKESQAQLVNANNANNNQTINGGKNASNVDQKSSTDIQKLISEIPQVEIIEEQDQQNNIVDNDDSPLNMEEINAGRSKKAKSKKDTANNKLSLKKYLPDNSMMPTELIFIETFECLRVNDMKIKNRIREFVNSLRPPKYFIKQFDIFNFLSNLPIKWPSQQNLVYFCKFFDTQNVAYYESELFTKSYSAYLFVEEQIRNTLNSIIQAFQEILNINRITTSEFERILNSNSKFGYTTREELKNTFTQLTLAGLDQYLIENLIKYLSKGNKLNNQKINKEQDQEDSSLINVGQIMDYMKQVETYSKIRNLYQYDEQLFRDQIINNFKAEIQANRIQIGVISLEKTQNCVEIDVKLCKELFQSVGVEMSFWECFCLLKEIQALNKEQVTNMDYNIKVPILQFNQYMLNLENSIVEQQKLPNNSIKQNDSEIHDLNMLLNKSLLNQRQQQQNQLPNNSQLKGNQEQQPNQKEEEHLLSYQFKFSIASLTEMRIKEAEDGKVVYLRYLLPLEEQNWIDSGIFELNLKKENYYRLALYGTHKIVIKNTENVLNLFKHNQIQIEIRELNNIDHVENKSEVHDNLIAKASLDVNSLLDLIESGDSNYVTRVTALSLVNNEDAEIGNLNFKIEFKKEIVQENSQKYQDLLYAKEQQLQKLLPKQGNLIINIRPNNIEEECVIQIKLFKDDTYLNHLFKPIQCNNVIENQMYFISISKEIVKYFEEGSAIVRILDKDASVLLGEYEFNLINLLVHQQIQINDTILNLITHKAIDLEINLTYEKQPNQKPSLL